MSDVALPPGPPQSAAEPRRPLLRHPFRRRHLQPVPLALVALWVGILAAARPTPAGFATGVSLVALGAALRLWAAGHLVKTDRLVHSGPYAHLRHPLYAGTLLFGVGLCLAAGGLVHAIVLPLFLAHYFLYFLPRKEGRESARLLERHGDAFAAYRAAVPLLLPRLRPWRPPGSPRCAWAFAQVRDNDELGALFGVATGLVLLALRGLVPL